MVDSLYGAESEDKSIWVFLERDGNKIENVSLELLNKSRQIADQLGWQVIGLLMGYKLDELIPQAVCYGADLVRVADHPLLDQFTTEAYCYVAFQEIKANRPSIFLCGATPNGRDLAGRLAVRLRTGLNADCTNLFVNTDPVVLVSEVSGFGGGVLALIEMAEHRPQMATVRPGVFKAADPDETRLGKLFTIEVQLTRDMVHTSVVDRVVGDSIDLTRADSLVVGGRGIRGRFEMMAELANLINAEYGTTRPPVDEGQVERERMVGQTGVICHPKVVICCGISGAFHFIVGIQDAETVIAINNDPEAPIFDHSDYNIVGDVYEVVPALIEALQATQHGQRIAKINHPSLTTRLEVDDG